MPFKHRERNDEARSKQASSEIQNCMSRIIAATNNYESYDDYLVGHRSCRCSQTDLSPCQGGSSSAPRMNFTPREAAA
ncbi:hypothetical protein L917_19337 [Phytophthora nicotianae]|uniref:Uncharacterized protein n=1 Tax=Phytophthora nicotianae TaxID=4792 RepID=W2K4V7_PHYNI|nr:hypothetical protein L917_19337 [Phytophthora nicotianae]